jgi:hypothetical protein
MGEMPDVHGKRARIGDEGRAHPVGEMPGTVLADEGADAGGSTE